MRKKILMIEDEESILDATVEFLLSEGFDIVSAEDGLIGLQRAREFLPDLIICDIMMPGLDGYGVLLELRQDPATATIPFIFLTAQTDRANIRHGMESGADDYLTKPFAIRELLAAINARLEKQDTLVQRSEQKLDDLRQALIVTLPHELRTPLMGIMGYADLMLDDVQSLTPDNITEMASYISQSGRRLYRLIENYLTYANIEIMRTNPARIQALRTNVTPGPQRVLEQAVIKAQQADREADLAVSSEDMPPARIAVNHLQKIVEELAENAFKFSEPGTPVRITANAENGWCVLRFIDHGRGMTREQITRIGVYIQFDRNIYEQQGSGLGLIIAKLLAELHGGNLAIESFPGQLTTVTVSLPLA